MIFYSRPKEQLEDHESKVIEIYNKMSDNINILKLVAECINEEVNANIIIELLNNVTKYHDYGKRNPYFQEYIKNNVNYDTLKREHSKLSALKYINDMFEAYIRHIKGGRKAIVQKTILTKIIINLSYNILKHHNDLDNIKLDALYINDLIEHYTKFPDKYRNIDINIDNLEYIKTLGTETIKFKNPFASYLLFKLNYAMLVKADYLAVYKFINNKDLNDNRLNNVKETLSQNFNNNEIIQNIYKYKNNEIELSEINTYRAKMFLESADNLIQNIDKYIFYLEAPTGSGKSTIAINLALNLVNDEFNRIVYVSPLNNISEQMYNGTSKMLSPISDETIALINNRESIITTDEYEKDYLNYQTFNYPIVMTSHVKFFNILFGRRQKDLLALESFRNSVIILDEIQNYKNKLWIKFINHITQISQMYNIKFIIMSATLPKMDRLIEDSNTIQPVNLIENSDYYYKFFRRRVQYDYSLLEQLKGSEKNTSEEILSKIDEVIENQNKHRILIETLSTKTCEEFYTYLKKYEDKGFMVYKMLSITNLNTRTSIIDDIQARNDDNTYKYKKIILIGTQCIEAGIDIDMNIGFKDISILDYDEQFIGRIERNFYDTGKCYFFDLNNEDYIYKDDYRIEFNLKNSPTYRELFENKKFGAYYEDNYEWLKRKEISDYEKYKECLNDLQYEDIEKSMQLIDNDTYSFLFMCEYTDVVNIYNSKEILKKYIELKYDFKIDYGEKQIKLKDIRKELSNFTYSINSYNFKDGIQIEPQEGFYVIEDSLRYFDNIYDSKLTSKSNLDLGLFINSINLFL